MNTLPPQNGLRGSAAYSSPDTASAEIQSTGKVSAQDPVFSEILNVNAVAASLKAPVMQEQSPAVVLNKILGPELTSGNPAFSGRIPMFRKLQKVLLEKAAEAPEDERKPFLDAINVVGKKITLLTRFHTSRIDQGDISQKTSPSKDGIEQL